MNDWRGEKYIRTASPLSSEIFGNCSHKMMSRRSKVRSLAKLGLSINQIVSNISESRSNVRRDLIFLGILDGNSRLKKKKV